MLKRGHDTPLFWIFPPRLTSKKIRKATAKRVFEAHDLLLRSYYAAKSSFSSSQVDFSSIMGHAFSFQHCVRPPKQGLSQSGPQSVEYFPRIISTYCCCLLFVLTETKMSLRPYTHPLVLPHPEKKRSTCDDLLDTIFFSVLASQSLSFIFLDL